jgi:oligopeptide transport system substrate-binding protein
MEEMPIAPIYFYTNAYLQKPYVHNIGLGNTGGIDFKWAYIEPTKGLR